VVFLRNQVSYKIKGKLEIEDIKTVKETTKVTLDIVVSRSTELKLVDEKTGILLTHIIFWFKYFCERWSIS
jgi:DNA-directed RNA polymerase subunit beta'